MSTYAEFYRRSIDDPDAFWAEQARADRLAAAAPAICDYSKPPFTRWFAGGTTNLCHNAVDRHLKDRADQPALIYVSTETGAERTYTFRELHAEVQRAAACSGPGREKGRPRADLHAHDRRGGVRDAGLRAHRRHPFRGVRRLRVGSLASRIEDATPKVIVSADAGSRGGKVVPYKPLLDEAIRLSSHKPQAVLLVDRGLAPMELVAGRDHDWAALTRQAHRCAGALRVAGFDRHQLHHLHQRHDRQAQGRAARHRRLCGGAGRQHEAHLPGRAGETYFSTSDIGWVVGHSYIIYGPLIAGMATIMYEGLPIRPDGGIWWSLVEKYKVTSMFSAPTAVRVLKKQDPALLKKYDLSSLSALFLAGEPLDEPTARWISEGLGVPIIDNYWQTETGWPILAAGQRRREKAQQVRQPRHADVRLRRQAAARSTGEELTGPNEKGVVVIEGPTPPGFMQTVWGDDARFVNTYWKTVPGKMVYSTFDWGIRDEDGYFFILGRTDDVINVAGHRLGTREIEESISGHPTWPRSRWSAWPTASRARSRWLLWCPRTPRADRRRRRAQARGRDHEGGGRAAGRRGAAVTRAFCHRCCPRPAAASCCAARSRRCAKAATPAT